MKSVPGILRLHLAACCVWLSVAGCKTREPEQARGARPANAGVSEKAAVLAELPGDEGAPASASPGAVAPQAKAPAAGTELVFSEWGLGVAYAVEERGKLRVVHNGRAGGVYAEVGPIALSADGSRCAHGALVDGEWRMVVDGREGASFDAVEPPVFSPDGRHLAYQARRGETWHLVVDTTATRGSRTRYGRHEFSADSSRIAFVDDADGEGWGRLVVSDLAFEKQTVVAPRASGLVSNGARTRIAAISQGDGGQRVLTLSLDRPDQVRRGRQSDAIYGLAFGADGVSLAYVAERDGGRLIVLDEKEEQLPPGDELVSHPVVRPDGSGLGAFVISEGAVFLRQYFVASGAGGQPYQGAEDLVYGGGGRFHAYAAEKDDRWFIVANGTEGPRFDRVVSPMFSPDGKSLVYRARAGGRRFVVVADPAGKTIRMHREYDQVFPVRFTAGGKSIAYGVKDGRHLAWKVEPL